MQPEKVIIEHLTWLNSQRLSDEDIAKIRQTPGVVYVPEEIDLDSVRFLKSRSLANYLLYFVTFNHKAFGPSKFICLLTRNPDNTWFMGGGIRSNSEKIPLETTRDKKARANLARGIAIGTSVPLIYFGGYVTPDVGAKKVQLVAANGLTLDDTVDEDAVLFLTDQAMPAPITAKILDDNNSVINEHQIS